MNKDYIKPQTEMIDSFAEGVLCASKNTTEKLVEVPGSWQ